MKFYICKHCGKVITLLNDVKVPTICCGEPMEELVGNTMDAALEKHVPVVEQKDHQVFVRVGEVEHPMTEEHYIEWIVVETEKQTYIQKLQPNQKPEATFMTQEPVVCAYAYCNLHSLWKKEI